MSLNVRSTAYGDNVLKNVEEYEFHIKVSELLTLCQDANSREEKIIIADEIFTCIANNIHLIQGKSILIESIKSKLISLYEDEYWEKARIHYFLIFGEEMIIYVRRTCFAHKISEGDFP